MVDLPWDILVFLYISVFCKTAAALLQHPDAVDGARPFGWHQLMSSVTVMCFQLRSTQMSVGLGVGFPRLELTNVNIHGYIPLLHPYLYSHTRRR
jgi:hypothetical protein